MLCAHVRTGVFTSPPAAVRNIAMSVSLCLSVSDISKTTCPNFTKFSVRYLWPWLDPPLIATSGFVVTSYLPIMGDRKATTNRAYTESDSPGGQYLGED